ncbi:DNA repair protein Rad52/59/22 [Vibrio phage 1.232.O._10N.261.51.E11]|nr:DNA repair protein Rad52/59/22 [Vibrio phage 1.232.O._10N.261.51.E11]
MESKKVDPIQKALQEMFLPEDIEWRVQQAGVAKNGPWVMAIPYLTSRAVQTRLDDAVGFGNWRNEFKEVNGGMLCGLSILINGNWITKWDGAPENKMHPVKGVVSDSTKRAAVQWGIGRYLYQLDVVFAIANQVESRRAATGNYHYHKGQGQGQNMHINWATPDLPAWAVPHEDLSVFMNAMDEAQSFEELREAFATAYKYSKAQGSDDMEDQFVKRKEHNKARINKNFNETAAKQFEAIKLIIDKQIAMFGQLPTKATIDNNFELAKDKLAEECKGKIFKHEEAFALLEAGYKTRIKSLNTKK